MKELGELLKTKRLEKGIELQEISDITKISIRYLNGIEHGDWSMMPGNFYVKGFIRSYAKILNLNVDSYLADVDNEIKKDEGSSIHISPTTAKPVKANRFGKLFALSLVIILVIVVFTFIIHYVSNVDRIGETLPEEDGMQQDVGRSDDILSEFEPLPEKEPPSIEPEVSNETRIQFIEQQQTTYFYNIIGEEEIEIRIEAVDGDCWYEIRSINYQGNVIATNTLRNGNIDVTRFNNSAWVSLGNPRAVDVYIDSQLIEVEEKGNPIRLQFNVVDQ